MNVAELKVDNSYLLKQVDNQKLIIQSMGIVISETEMQVDILDQKKCSSKNIGFLQKTWIWVKGIFVGAAAIYTVLVIL